MQPIQFTLDASTKIKLKVATWVEEQVRLTHSLWCEMNNDCLNLPGYVLSNEALVRFVERGLDEESNNCGNQDTGEEDVELGKCLASVKVLKIKEVLLKEILCHSSVFVDLSRRHKRRWRQSKVFPISPSKSCGSSRPRSWKLVFQKPGLSFRTGDKWFLPHFNVICAAWFLSQGIGCCSNSAISFHYMTPADLYATEYMLYHINPLEKGKIIPILEPKRVLENLDGISKMNWVPHLIMQQKYWCTVRCTHVKSLHFWYFLSKFLQEQN